MRRGQKKHRYQWVIDALSERPSFVQRAMFGAQACYLHGKLMLALSAGKEPWRGVLLPTERIHHASLKRQFPLLRMHPILGKWLYLPELSEGFEETTMALVERILDNDFRIGVRPSQRKRAKPA